MNESHDCQALLAQVGWVRALAQHLTRDGHAADDLAQDAIQAALVRPPPDDRPLQSWLAGIVRNLALHERRSAGSRRARELSAARDEGQPSSSELVERLDSHRAVVDAVGRLEEPYRTAILLRYFEGLSPRAIASRTSVPLRTVHTRLHRALARLRAELDRAHGGDRRSWLLALIPLARDPGGWTSGAIGTFVMNAKLKIALAVVALAGVCSIALWSSGASDAGHPAAVTKGTVALSESPPAPARSEPLQDPSTDVARSARADTPAVVAPAAPPAAPTPKLSGRVIDVERTPVAGVKVRWFGAAQGARSVPDAVTDTNGRFELEGPAGPGRVDVDSTQWTSLFRPDFRAEPVAQEVVIVVAPSVTLGGVVVDAQHRPVASASVAVPLPYGLRARFDAVLDSSSSVERSVQTDAEGRFELEHVPVFAGATLVTSHAAYAPDMRALESHDDRALEIVLKAMTAEKESLVGTVVDPDGMPVEGARVALGTTTTKSGPDGVFAFALADPGVAQATRLRALRPGNLPGELERGAAWPEPLVLRLGAAPLAIEGRVVDADGKPVARAEVWTSDETHFGYVELEGGESTMRFGSSVEGLLRGEPFTPRLRTDAVGRFALTGLLPREYRVHVLDTRHMRATTATLSAGVHDVEIRLPREPVHERLAGRVTSLSGQPIEGVHVILLRRSVGVDGLELDRMESAPAKTDAEGRFAFTDVSSAITSVQVRGAELALEGFSHPIGASDDVLDLVLKVPLTVHVQVDATGRSDVDSVVILDEHGEQLELSIQHGNSAYGMRNVRLIEGRTEVFSVSETARTLVLQAKGAEVERVPITLSRGELNTLRL